jgi:dienelactone hydrolase
MRVPSIVRSAIAATVLLLSLPALAQTDPWAGAERKPGRVAAISPKLNEEAWFVPGGPGADGKPALLKARVFRPDGAGPFKVAIVNHGSPPSAADRPTMTVPRFRSASEWLVGRGYMVVLPLRRGYGEPADGWPETYGPCRNPDYVAGGRATADDIVAVVGYARTLPMAHKDRVLLVGHSAGGFGVVAASNRNPDGVFAVLNVAGGRGGHQGGRANANCVPELLVDAMKTFGAGARVPTLWLYSKNDSFFEPTLSKRMVDAYKAAGGKADYHLLPAFESDGHDMFGNFEGRALWTEPVAAFLQKLE